MQPSLLQPAIGSESPPTPPLTGLLAIQNPLLCSPFRPLPNPLDAADGTGAAEWPLFMSCMQESGNIRFAPEVLGARWPAFASFQTYSVPWPVHNYPWAIPVTKLAGASLRQVRRRVTQLRNSHRNAKNTISNRTDCLVDAHFEI